MDVATQDIVTEALNELEDRYKRWTGLKHSSEAEKELAKEKIKKIEHARSCLSKLV